MRGNECNLTVGSNVKYSLLSKDYKGSLKGIFWLSVIHCGWESTHGFCSPLQFCIRLSCCHDISLQMLHNFVSGLLLALQRAWLYMLPWILTVIVSLQIGMTHAHVCLCTTLARSVVATVTMTCSKPAYTTASMKTQTFRQLLCVEKMWTDGSQTVNMHDFSSSLPRAPT